MNAMKARPAWPQTKAPWVMGILNVTPDSFSDGGQFHSLDNAVARARVMISEGADIIDVGGESTRPGSQPVSEDEQIHRVVPVIQSVRTFSEIPISIDTTRAAVARAALSAGADWVNDVSALRDDSEMVGLISETGCPVVLMHKLGEPRTMQVAPRYDDVVREVREFLAERAAFAQSHGIRRENIILDPGIGFGKTLEHNLVLLHHLSILVAAGYPILVGASRKSFIGQLTGLPVEDRLEGSLAAAVLAVQAGVHIVRVHDVAPTKRALAVASAISRQSQA
jgi:dihydropteroate synthase